MPIKKRLIFGEGLLGPALLGSKLITLRRYRAESHALTKGEIIVGEFHDGLDILLFITADTELKPFGEVTDDEAQEDGFENTAKMLEGLKSYYPDLTSNTTAAIIRFQVLRHEGLPTVSVNKYAEQ